MDDEIRSEIVPEEFKRRAEKLSQEHVEWLFRMMKPLLMTEFQHGFRHGWEDKENNSSRVTIEDFESTRKEYQIKSDIMDRWTGEPMREGRWRKT